MKNYRYENLFENNERLESLNNTLSPDEAIKAGTIFKTLDKPYKGYVVKNFNNLNEQEQAMLEIQKYGIMVHDLSLYLDVYPDDYEAVNLRKKYSEILANEMRKYESIYPAFSKESPSLNKVPYSWSTTVFPWGDE